ncbi:MAG: tRNA (guanine-N1)-methyltransferase [Prochloraceae cyanobacterium]|nr:tRNA (guanine-N1)-methyltransferase [Prochloraceae cyanobacterium]
MKFFQERKAKFLVGNAFYRCESEVVRDLGVLAAAIYKGDRGSLRVLDVMSGSGVRSLRYWLEGGADWIWTNDSNPELNDLLQQNLGAAIASGCLKLTHRDANRIFFDCYDRKDYYDLVDVDSFGAGLPFLDTMLWATKIGGLIYLTSTDGKTGTGHLPENSLKMYGSYTRIHPAAQEQALRLLIGKMQQSAASKGLGIEPIFSLFAAKTYRIMARLSSKPRLNAENYGFLGYCHACGQYQTIDWRKLGQNHCPVEGSPLTLTGPLWLGKLHDRNYLEQMITLAENWQWPKRVELLQIMRSEADLPPYFYTLGEIGRRGKMDIPKRSQLILAIQNRGYRASATHIDPQAIKTDMTLLDCISVARELTTALDFKNLL